MNIPGIGFVCIDPAPGCASGEIDCDGGNALDTDLFSNHNFGSCASNAACQASCASACTTFNLGTLFDSGCEGFCEGGTRDNLSCLYDSECPGGSCNGGDSLNGTTLPHGNICGCACIDVGGAASTAGGRPHHARLDGFRCNRRVEFDH